MLRPSTCTRYPSEWRPAKVPPGGSSRQIKPSDLLWIGPR